MEEPNIENGRNKDKKDGLLKQATCLLHNIMSKAMLHSRNTLSMPAKYLQIHYIKYK